MPSATRTARGGSREVAEYCRRDVEATAALFRRLETTLLPLFKPLKALPRPHPPPPPLPPSPPPPLPTPPPPSPKLLLFPLTYLPLPTPSTPLPPLNPSPQPSRIRPQDAGRGSLPRPTCGMMITAMPTDPTSPDPAAAWRAVLAPRRLAGRHVRLRRRDDRRLLPSVLRRPPAEPRERALLRRAPPRPSARVSARACAAGPRRRESPTAVRAVRRAVVFLETHADESVPLATLARVGRPLAVSLPADVQEARRRDSEEVRRRAARRPAEGAPQGRRAGAAATFEAGYGSASRAYASAPRHLGTTPARYARGGRGLHVRFATVPTPLGRLLVAATEGGVCAVTLGDSERALEEGLRREYPEAVLEKAPAALAEWTGEDRALPRRRVDLSHDPARPPRHDVPAPRLRGAARRAARRDALVRRARGRDRPALGGARRRLGLRAQPRGARRPVPPHRARRRLARRLPLGRRAEAASS